MKLKSLRTKCSQELTRCLIALAMALLIVPGNALSAVTPVRSVDDTAVTIPPEQLDSLVAPIALYPDNLLSQTLVASTYPLEIIQLQQ